MYVAKIAGTLISLWVLIRLFVFVGNHAERYVTRLWYAGSTRRYRRQHQPDN